MVLIRTGCIHFNKKFNISSFLHPLRVAVLQAKLAGWGLTPISHSIFERNQYKREEFFANFSLLTKIGFYLCIQFCC
jgi:hypothetical protein